MGFGFVHVPAIGAPCYAQSSGRYCAGNPEAIEAKPTPATEVADTMADSQVVEIQDSQPEFPESNHTGTTVPGSPRFISKPVPPCPPVLPSIPEGAATAPATPDPVVPAPSPHGATWPSATAPDTEPGDSVSQAANSPPKRGRDPSYWQFLGICLAFHAVHITLPSLQVTHHLPRVEGKSACLHLSGCGDIFSQRLGES